MAEGREARGAGMRAEQCWSCGAEVLARALFCHACGRAQPPRPMNHFARFGLPVSREVDRDLLERCYRAFRRSLSPARLEERPAREREYARAHLAALVEARVTLGHEGARAAYVERIETIGAAVRAASDVVPGRVYLLGGPRREGRESAPDGGVGDPG